MIYVIRVLTGVIYEVNHISLEISLFIRKFYFDKNFSMPNNRQNKRTREITIRVTDDELEKLHDRKTDATLAGWLRNLGLGATPIKQADPNMIRALGRMGSNLNQIAKHANTHNQLDQNVLIEISAIREVLTDLIQKNLQAED